MVSLKFISCFCLGAALFFKGDINRHNALQSASLKSPAMTLEKISCVSLYLRTRCKVDITQKYFDTSNILHTVELYSSMPYGTSDWQKVQFTMEPPSQSSALQFVLNIQLVFGDKGSDPFYITDIDLQEGTCGHKGKSSVICDLLYELVILHIHAFYTY